MPDTINQLFDELTRLQQGQRLPPVADWHPQHVGHIDIRIDRDGNWFHEGGLIRRKPLVRLFSRVLRKDPDGYCLVTPGEKELIEVEDVPFTAIDLEVKQEAEGLAIALITNVDEVVIADADHRIYVNGLPDEPRPYVQVRDGLDALIARSVYYRLVELCTGPDAEGRYWLSSRGARFQLG